MPADVAIGPNTGALVLLPGQVDYRVVADGVQITDARSSYNATTTASWRFSQFRRFKGVWIASEIALVTHMLDGSPNATIAYALTRRSRNQRGNPARPL